MRPDIQALRQAKGEADGNFWPITKDAPAPLPGLPALASLKTVTLDPVFWGGLENSINSWFAKTMAAQ
jgi:iron(III) transport system substrate-binding protein